MAEHGEDLDGAGVARVAAELGGDPALDASCDGNVDEGLLTAGGEVADGVDDDVLAREDLLHGGIGIVVGDLGDFDAVWKGLAGGLAGHGCDGEGLS